MTSLPAKVVAIEERGFQYQVVVQITTKYRGSFNTLAFGEIKPYSGSLKDGRLDQSRGASQTLLILSYASSSSNQCERSDEVLAGRVATGTNGPSFCCSIGR
jgi:hypothetical protein